MEKTENTTQADILDRYPRQQPASSNSTTTKMPQSDVHFQVPAGGVFSLEPPAILLKTQTILSVSFQNLCFEAVMCGAD